MQSQITPLISKSRSRSHPEKLETVKLKVVNVFQSDFLPNQNKYIYVKPKHNYEYYRDIIDPSRRRSLYEIYKLEQKKLKNQSIVKKIRSQSISVEDAQQRKVSSLQPLSKPGVLKEINEKRIQNQIEKMIIQADTPLELVSQKVKLMKIRLTQEGKLKRKREDVIQENNFSDFIGGVNKKWCAQHKKISRTMCISKKFDASGSPWKIQKSQIQDDSPVKNS